MEVRMDSRIGLKAGVGGDQPKTEKLIEGIYEHLMDQYVPSSVVIDPELNILHVWGDINGFVRIPKGNLTYNLLRLLDQKVGIIVSNAIRTVQKSGGEIMFRDVQIDTDEGPTLKKQKLGGKKTTLKKSAFGSKITSFWDPPDLQNEIKNR